MYGTLIVDSYAFADAQTETLSELPSSPGNLATQLPALVTPLDSYVFSYSSSFLMRTVVFEPPLAFTAWDAPAAWFTTRTTCRAFVYAKKFAAVKKSFLVFAFGF